MIRSLTLALLCPLVAGAQETAKPRALTFGAGLASALFFGDVRDIRGSSPDLGLYLEGGMHLAGPHGVRLRVEFPVYSSTAGWFSSVSGYSSAKRLRPTGIGLDYVHTFSPEARRGFFLTGGLAFHHWSTEYCGAIQGAPSSPTVSSNHLGLSAGVGYRLGRFVMELKAMDARATRREWRAEGDALVWTGDKDKKGGSLQLSVGFR